MENVILDGTDMFVCICLCVQVQLQARTQTVQIVASVAVLTHFCDTAVILYPFYLLLFVNYACHLPVTHAWTNFSALYFKLGHPRTIKFWLFGYYGDYAYCALFHCFQEDDILLTFPILCPFFPLSYIMFRWCLLFSKLLSKPGCQYEVNGCLFCLWTVCDKFWVLPKNRKQMDLFLNRLFM